MIRDLRPMHVIDLTAFHNTDLCESEIELAFAVNCHAKANVARVCSEIQAVMTYISTDYVFDGSARAPQVETDATNPINVYGISRRAGESVVQNFASKYFIFRVSGLFGVAGASGKGGNFVETMIRLAREGKSIG